MPQTATTGNLADAQRTIIEAAKYQTEHNAPSWNLVQKFTLPKGAKVITVPFVGQYTFSDLVDGEDMTDEQTIGMTTVDLTSNEVGAKIIITDKLARQNGTTDIMQMIGKQFGAGAARKMDTDIQANYSSLNASTTYGLAGKNMTAANAAALIARAKGKTSQPFAPDYVVHHPNAIFDLTKSLNVIGAATTVATPQIQNSTVANFWRVKLSGVNFFEAGNISIDSSDDAIGAIAQKDAIYCLSSKGFATERERDASRRAWELNHVADYGTGILDSQRGAPVTYDCSTPSDTA